MASCHYMRGVLCVTTVTRHHSEPHKCVMNGVKVGTMPVAVVEGNERIFTRMNWRADASWFDSQRVSG